MKKVTFLLFFVIITYSYSQTKELLSGTTSHFSTSLSIGISSPLSSYSDASYASSGSFFEVSGNYYFSQFGLGLSLGKFSNPTEGNLTEFTNKAAYPITNSSESWKTSYYSIGPSYKTSFNNLEASIYGRAGLMSTKPISLQGSFNAGNADTATSIPVYSFSHEKSSQTGFYSTGIKLGYKLNPGLSFYIQMNYLSSFSDKITIEEGRKQFTDINKDGVIDEIDIVDGTQVEFQYTSKNIKPQTLNVGFGLAWNIHKKAKQKAKVEVRSWNPKDKSGKTKGSIVFTNPVKEKADKKNKDRKLVNVFPKNNDNFQVGQEIEKFTWSVIGERIMQPKYLFEVSKIGSNRQVQWMFSGHTTKTTLTVDELMKQNSSSARVSERLRHKDRTIFTEGQYRWKVAEISTGISSNPSFFNFSNCEIDFAISNEEIECLGYEGADRKFKICFDSTYSSTSGDLTFLNPSSGLTVYDQTYASISFTLVSPNPTLLTQIGATTSTVSYCFEVTVPNSVTSIGFGLQGDDLDPSPILCQPGVSALFNDLPDCLCDECEDIELSFDNFNISLNGATGNQFNFNGNINVNVPIYGIEFQIQSYSYTASPSACTEGVSSIEESGMFLMPGTTINGSSTLQLFNESASGSSSSNDNATKDILYTSSSPLTGPIPVNLTIGLPGPISGLDPSCCTIEYTVCIKVRVYLEEGNCKSCVFTHCFEFNNQ